MNGNLSSASVVLHVVSETECLLTKDRGKFLLLLDLLFVKDTAELVEGILCVTTERRDILRRIISDVDCPCGNDRFCCTACISLDGHGDVRGKTDGVVDFVLLVLGHVFIVAVFVVGDPDTLCTVVCFVLKIDNSIFLFFLDLLKPFTKDIHP